MKQKLDDITLAEGNNELNVQMAPVVSVTPESIYRDLIEPRLDYFSLVWAGNPAAVQAVTEAVYSGVRALGEWSAGDIHALAMTMLMGYPYRDIPGYQTPYVGITGWQSFEDYVRMSSPALNNQVDGIMALGGSFQDWVKYRIVVLFTRTYVIGVFSNDEVRQIFAAYGISLPDVALTYRG